MIPSIQFSNDFKKAQSITIIGNQVIQFESNCNKDVVKLINGKKKKGIASVFYIDSEVQCQALLIEKEKKEKQELYYEKVRIQASKISTDTIVGLNFITDDKFFIEAFIEGIVLSNYKFTETGQHKKYKDSIVLNKNVQSIVGPLMDVIEEVVWARDLVNLPLSHLTAEQLASKIKERGEKLGLEVDIFNKKKLASLKMGGILSVNKGSIDPPTFTIVNYKPKGVKNKKPIVLVGKGVVYDTGGMSLKPTANSMDMMKSDMGGAACVASTIMAIAKLKLPIHVVALIPATDNRPGQNAYVPGDVVTMFDGTTIEVMNTDAEGRMLLADALSYAKKYDPELVIDAATLTGAAVRAIGSNALVAMGNADAKWFDKLVDLGEECHERVAVMPFWDDYKEELKSDVADMKNIGGPYAGQITAGKFLEHFTDYPYMHLDIAGPSFLMKKEGYKTKGGTGFGTRLLVNFFKKYND